MWAGFNLAQRLRQPRHFPVPVFCCKPGSSQLAAQTQTKQKALAPPSPPPQSQIRQIAKDTAAAHYTHSYHERKTCHMPPMGKKHWCKHCKKSFSSGNSLGGHMALHRDRGKKRPSSKPSVPSIDAERYGLRERRGMTWWHSYSTSSDDEPWALFSKTECQLCFKSFASLDALSMHMRIHARHEKKMLAAHKASMGDDYHNATVFAAPVKKRRSRRMVLGTVSTPVMETYGIREVDAARILLMLSGGPGMYSASVDCDEDCEMDGNLACHTLMTEIELNSIDHALIGHNELMESETSSSYEEVKFGSLSEVLRATTSHECKLCGKIFVSGQALGGHMKCHCRSAVAQPCKQLLEVDHDSFVLSLPAPNYWNSSSTRPNSGPNPWCGVSSLQSEQMLGVV